MIRVLDACCGSRMFWLDRMHPSAVFMDCRHESHVLTDRSSQGGSRLLTVQPDIVADFRAMPFRDGVFDLVVFDPPHFTRNGQTGWMAKKYGTLNRDTWREDLRRGFAECFRVCRMGGTVVCKWNENEIAVRAIIELAPCAPLIGHRFGRRDESHWLVFLKSEEAMTA